MPGGFLTLEIENNFSSIWLYSRCYSLCIPCAFFTNPAIYVNESDPRSNVHYLGSSENKARKNSGLYGIWTHDLCDTGTALYQLS